MNEKISQADLERWEEHGAMWRAVDVDDAVTVVQLCTCLGEPVELVSSREPEVIAYVRERMHSAGAA